MSRAFIKEVDGQDFIDEVPDRPISPERNFVTARGLRLIEAEEARARSLLSKAQAAGDRVGQAQAARDHRYWSARLASAEVVPTPADTREVRFGHRVTLEREDGRRSSFRIVGLDEADPAQGLISYPSPVARALINRQVGDSVRAGPGVAEIIAVEPGDDGAP